MKRLASAMATGVLLAASTVGAAATLEQAALTQLVERCAPQVSPSTMLALIAHESGANPYAIGVNGPTPQALQASSATEAASYAKTLIEDGRSADFGLGQINSANLARLKLTATTVFNPCSNIAAAAKLLTEAYVRVRPTAISDQAALDAALSTYNTGSPHAGVSNGYVARVRNRYTVPALATETTEAVTVRAQRTSAPAWDVYGSARQVEPPAPTRPTPTTTAATPATAVMVFEQQQGN